VPCGSSPLDEVNSTLGSIYTVLGIEITRGVIADFYEIVRGEHVAGYLVWIVIHSTVLLTGVHCLRDARRRSTTSSSMASAAA
jgi:hypothetical protein